MSTDVLAIPSLSLRQLKAAMYVSRYGNLTHAASKLSRTQTAITKAINSLEEQLGVQLFDRSNLGMTATAYGRVLTTRIEQAEKEFIAAGEAYLEHKPDAKRYNNIALFSMDISYKRLVSFIALYDTRGIAAAADRLSITRAAIYNAVRQLEELLDLNLFERRPSGLEATNYCHILARHLKLIFSSFVHAMQDIANIDSVVSGKVKIGCLPYAQSLIAPLAINQLQDKHPQLEVSTVSAPYTTLESLLRSGDIDIIIGDLRSFEDNINLQTETLFNDSLLLAVRNGHPLLESASNLTLRDIHQYGWILPSKRTPARELFDHMLRKQSSESIHNSISTNSFSTARGLLMNSDRIALLSKNQIQYDLEFKLFSMLDVALENNIRPIGFTTRSQSQLPPAVQLFIEKLRLSAGKL